MSLMHRTRGGLSPAPRPVREAARPSGDVTVTLRLPARSVRAGGEGVLSLAGAWEGDALLEFAIDAQGGAVTLRHDGRDAGQRVALAGDPDGLLGGAVRVTRVHDDALGLLHVRAECEGTLLLDATIDTRTGSPLYARTGLWAVLGVEGGRYEVALEDRA